MKKLLVVGFLFAALAIASTQGFASNTYCTTDFQTVSGTCANSGSIPMHVVNGFFVIPFTFNIANTASDAGFANGDVLKLAQIAGGANPCDLKSVQIDFPQLDSGSSMTLEIGDTGSAGRYVASTSTLGRAAFDGSITGANGFVANSIFHQYTATDTLELTVTASPGTAVTSGTMKGMVEMWCGANP